MPKTTRRRDEPTTTIPTTNRLVPLPWHDEARMALATHRIVILVGDPGSGKSRFVQEACRAATGKIAHELQGGPSCDGIALFGHFQLAGDSTRYVPGPLRRALLDGSFFVLNDAGQIPFAQMSSLLPLRHAEAFVDPIAQDELVVPEEFRMVLTMNRDNPSCRSNLSAMESLLDGAVVVDVPNPGEGELRAMLVAEIPGIEDSMIDRLLAIRKRFLSLATKDGDQKKAHIGVRALQQLARLLLHGMPETAAIRQSVVGKFLLQKDLYDAAMLTNNLG
jgi:MoxR-like ATPase